MDDFRKVPGAIPEAPGPRHGTFEIIDKAGLLSARVSAEPLAAFDHCDWRLRVDKRRSHLPDSSRCPRTQGVQTSVNKVQSYVNLDTGPGVGADAREIV
jgi:hypothetical protein